MISGHNVVQIKQKPTQVANFPAIAQVEGYWHGLFGGSSIPYRNDVNPRGMENSLAFAFVLERIAPRVCRFRVAGHHLIDLMGFDVRGMPVSAMISPESRHEIGKILESICTEPCIQEVFLHGGKRIGAGELQGKMFLAPLLDEAGQVARLLGCLQTVGKIGRQPRRFGIADVHKKKLDAAVLGHQRNANTLCTSVPAKLLVQSRTIAAPAKPILKGSTLQVVVDNA